MYSKEYKSEMKKLFYTSFGKYMSKNKSINDTKIKWPNYKTNIKDLYFKIDCNENYTKILIDIQHSDDEIRNLFFDQFLELKNEIYCFDSLAYFFGRILKISNISI